MAKSKQSPINHTGINAAVIMDGNGRWAKKNALNVTSGHERGVKVVREIVEAAAKAKLESLTLFAFSTENWSRPKNEILGIKKLIIKAISSEIDRLVEKKVTLKFFGHYHPFGEEIAKAINNAEKISYFEEPSLKLNIALGYGGRSDIIEATKLIASDVKLGKLLPEDVSSETIFKYLNAPINELDLLIRTGGDHRISNFLLYHLAYTEIQFSNTLWPDFTVKEFTKCLEVFSKTERRFGKRSL